MKRPAEIGGVAGAVAYLVCYFARVTDPGVLTAMGIVFGFVPAAITWAVVTFRKPAAGSSNGRGH